MPGTINLIKVNIKFASSYLIRKALVSLKLLVLKN
jgi:hypothetical protein